MTTKTQAETLRNLQRNYNADGSITVYLNHYKQFRGTPRQAAGFIRGWYGDQRRRPHLCKDTFTSDVTRH